MIEELKKRLDSARFVHSLEVAELSRELARRFGENEEKAYLAGILHDCAKKIPKEQALKLCEEFKISLIDVELNNPALIHAPLGAEIAKREFGVDDEDIYNAIKNHTVGRAGMSKLEKIIYVADMAEPGRNFEGVLKIRTALKNDLDDGVLYALKFSVQYNLERNKLIHPGTIDAWNDIKLKKGEW